jgi:hypothetical protein
MSNGVLGKSMSVANTDVVVYTVPVTAEFATVSIQAVNTGVLDATVRVAIGTSPTPSIGDYIEYDTIIPANGGGLNITCMLCSTTENVIVRANTNDIAIRVFGLEKLI